MLEAAPFILMKQTIAPDMIEKAIKELYTSALWSDYASNKLKSAQRRTAVMKRFPAAPVNPVTGGYHAPASWVDECVVTLNMARMPTCAHIVSAIMAENGWSKLGISLVSELQPGGTIPEHSDEGEYFSLMHRVHIPLISDGSPTFKIDGVVQPMKPGEVWLIDNCHKHEVFNNSELNRVNLYFDAC